MGTSVLGTTGDDDLVGVGMDGAGSGSQVHMWAGQGDDTLRLDFDSNFNNTKFHSQGHHARGDADGGNAGQGLGSGLIGVYAGNVNLQQYRGEDQFRFENTANVTGIAYGRIEDFQLGEDKIFVDGIELDMSNMTAAGQALPGGGHAKVVLEQGAHDDPGAVPQYYLLIETSSGGTIFYALEGARVDMVGTPPNSGDQELHFLNYANRPDWSSHVAVDYEDPQNYIPAAYLDLNVSGQKIIDYDSVRQDVLDIISGTSNDDLIAAGLNDDTV